MGVSEVRIPSGTPVATLSGQPEGKRKRPSSKPGGNLAGTAQSQDLCARYHTILPRLSTDTSAEVSPTRRVSGGSQIGGLGNLGDAQYQTFHSVSDTPVFVVCRDGTLYEIVPDDVRRQGP